ncbi:uncharacterized protein K441DRAFT_652412 [Cenococcum geophilum 1.58]|uniref:uncharacterized protein n=1 Tax=Cenococcum geophilum 1.58 TaxID=794803 RepID=UPI00358F9089|nr:hypothetical protein K441DRAFT_652412 [Cenococcum geophilum 1.58]
MAPLPETLLYLLPRSLIPSIPTINIDARSLTNLSPMAVRGLHTLQKRAPSVDPAAGSQPANAINNQGFQALFALIGAGMVLGSIWFFFWAKNGGFKWRESDWDDYKSTVLRRKGPDGKTLSNATKSTRLGGGSVVAGGSYGRSAMSEGYTNETGTSADMSEIRDMEAGHGHRHGIRGGGRTHRKESSKHKDPDVLEYRHEKPARVGGLNRQHDGSYFDYSNTEPSEVNSNVSQQPLTANKNKKQDKKERERRAKEARRSERAAQKSAAAEAKAQKEAEKASKAKAKNIKAIEEKPQSEAAGPSASNIPHPDAVQAARRSAPSAAYSFVTGDDTATVYTAPYTAPYTASAPTEAGETYYTHYRPRAEPDAAVVTTRSHSSTPNRREREHRSGSHSRHSSPRRHRSSRPSSNSDIFSSGGTDETGTKSYPCIIPGLSASSVGVGESVSQVGGSSGGRRGRDVMDGYRRSGARGRRDSLSDSDS